MQLVAKSVDPHAWVRKASLQDIQGAIAGAAAELKREYALREIDRAECARSEYRTTDFTIDQRIRFWEEAQDRMWEWYRVKNGSTGEAGA